MADRAQQKIESTPSEVQDVTRDAASQNLSTEFVRDQNRKANVLPTASNGVNLDILTAEQQVGPPEIHSATVGNQIVSTGNPKTEARSAGVTVPSSVPAQEQEGQPTTASQSGRIRVQEHSTNVASTVDDSVAQTPAGVRSPAEVRAGQNNLIQGDADRRIPGSGTSAVPIAFDSGSRILTSPQSSARAQSDRAQSPESAQPSTAVDAVASRSVFSVTLGENGGYKVIKPLAPDDVKSRTPGGDDVYPKAAPPDIRNPISTGNSESARPGGTAESVGVERSPSSPVAPRVEAASADLRAPYEGSGALRAGVGSQTDNLGQTRSPIGSTESQTRSVASGTGADIGRDAGVRDGGAVRDNSVRDASTRDGAPTASRDANVRDVAAARQSAVSGALDVQGRTPIGSVDARQPVAQPTVDARQGNVPAALDGQGRLGAANPSSPASLGNSGETFSTRRETGIQLPETKQSTGRTDTGGIPNSDGSRVNSGRNDANTAKLPDAKTLQNLDQKFGDNVNPPGTRGGIPIAVPGIPDILGGLRGDRDGKPGKDPKAAAQGDREGKESKGEAAGAKDSRADGKILDEKGDTKAGGSVGDGKGDTKSGVSVGDDKGVPGQKGSHSDSDNASKPNDGRLDGRTNTADNRIGADGRPLDGRQQGGSNLVHDVGTASGAGHGDKSDGASDRNGKSHGEVPGVGDKSHEGSVGGNTNAHGEKIGADGKGVHSDSTGSEAKTRVDSTAPRVVDADGKLIGSKPDLAAGKAAGIHADGSVKGGHSDGVGILPPGSLPVPDLVGKIKNIGDIKNSIDGVKTFVTGGTRVGDTKLGDGRTADGKSIDGKSVDPKSGNGKLGDSKPLDSRPSRAQKGDGGVGIVGINAVRVGDNLNIDGRSIGNKIEEGVKAAMSAINKPVDAKTTDGKSIDVKAPGGKSADDKSISVSGVAGKVADGRGVDAKPTEGKIHEHPEDGVRTVVTGSARTGDGAKTGESGKSNLVGDTTLSALDGKQIAGKNNRGIKTDTVLIMTPPAVPLNAMLGNLKGIAARIFPPESRNGRPDVFDNVLPGRKTEMLEDRTPAVLNQPLRSEPAIPITRLIGGRVGQADEQFTVKAINSADANRSVASRGETRSEIFPVVGKHGGTQSAHSNEKQDPIVHDEAAERLLVDLEIVGLTESTTPVEFEIAGSLESANSIESEEEVFPLAAGEYFGGEFEKSIVDEDEVMFDGDGSIAADDEQSTRYQYVVESGDTVELIAIKIFKNVILAPLIYEINKDAIPIGMQNGRMVFNLKVGTIIWLPFPSEIKNFLEQSNALNET